MKRIFLVAILFPFLSIAQKKPAVAPAKKPMVAAPVTDAFVIEGDVKGYPDGTTVALLNGQTGAPESETTVSKDKFSFKGKLATPDFKIILFNKQQPYITLFLDNSNVKISGSKENLNAALVTGSPSHNDFGELNNMLVPYQKLFGENAVSDPGATATVMGLLENFVQKKPASYIAPLAVIRYLQVSQDAVKTEALLSKLSPSVKSTPMANYLVQQLTETRRNAVGTELADFTQPDTEGKPVSLSSFRGKYVLIDFWASWCRPCRQENPNVVASFNKFKDKNFTVLGVSLDKAKPAWIDAITMDGLTWPHVSDLQGWSNSVAQQFQIQSIPQNFLIGPDGKIIAKNLRGPALEQKLEQLLK